MSSAEAKPRIRPRDAAVLVISRRDADGARVLMGQRHGGHVFMPNKFVFPGGRVDRADSALAARFGLRPDVEKRVAHGCSPVRARALALAAIRETYEETGLLVGRPAAAPAPRTRSAPWRAYFRHALQPPLEALEFLARAITPPANPRRFDTRFFMVDAALVQGDGADALTGSGELLDLHWVPVGDARKLDVPEVTNGDRRGREAPGLRRSARPARPVRALHARGLPRGAAVSRASRLFSCPGAAARGGGKGAARGKHRHLCVDVHCHVHYPPADALVQHAFDPTSEPALRFSNALSRRTNQQQMANVQVCLTSVEQRLRDMDKMGVDVQALSCSPMQFKYSLEPELGQRAARAINENLAAIVAQHPDRFVALANVPLQAPDLAAAELEHCVKALGFRGVEIGTNVAGAEISRGRDAFWAKAQELEALVFLHPNGFTGGERLADHYFNNLIGNPLDSTLAVAHLMFDGILERFPKLRIVVAHGGGYVAHYPGRMDHAWSARDDTRTALRHEPSRSLAKLYFDTLVFDREQLRHLVNLWGAERLVVGTDYPFDMGWYDPRGFVGGCDFLRAADKARLLGGNAAKLLKLRRAGRSA